jgi:adenosylmethionine-8-amino-7-oxononanoate aminotransferase
VLLDHQHVLEVRNYGSMFGVELVASRTGGVADGSPRNTTGGRAQGLAEGVDVPVWFPTDSRIGHRVCLAARERGVIIRPLGDTVVIMPPYCTDEPAVARIVSVLREAIDVSVVDVLDAVS